MRKLCDVAAADFKERVWRFSFLAMAALMLLAAFWLVPNPKLGYEVLCVERNTFVQGTNPTWLSMGAAITLAAFLPLFGFVFIKNAIETDRNTGVINLVRASGVKRIIYMFGKYISSLLLLLLLMVIEMSGTLLMTIVRFPGQHISAWSFFSPFFALIPGFLIICALALLFEVFPLLGNKAGGVLGIVAFFIFSIISLTEVMSAGQSEVWRKIDFSGLSWIVESISADTFQTAQIAHPLISIADFNPTNIGITKEIYFSGLIVGKDIFINKLCFVLIGILMVLVSAVFLDYEQGRKKNFLMKTDIETKEEAYMNTQVSFVNFKLVPAGKFSFFDLFRQEMHRYWRGISCVWLMLSIGLWLVCAFSTDIQSRIIWMLILYGWCILMFSKMGSEERMTGMDKLYCGIEKGELHHRVCALVVGMLFSLILVCPVLIRTLSEVRIAGTVSLLIWALTIPVLASLLGDITQSPRLFQIIFLMIIYLKMNSVELLWDFNGNIFDNKLIIAIFVLLGLCVLYLCDFPKRIKREM